MAKLLIIVTTLVLVLTNKVCSQSITLQGNTLGFIVLDDTIYNGSGFVMLKPNYVITCAHVVDTTKRISFSALKSNILFKLKVVKIDIDNDLALLESDTIICEKPLQPAETFNVQPRQHLFYIGYNITKSNDREKSMQVDNAYVNAIGKVASGRTTVDFIEFRGVGIPGYSGGPVFNDNGQIVGVMREAWLKQGIKGGKVELVNRAYSITPILK